MKRLLFLIIIGLWSYPAVAGMLQLVNGDRIEGEFIKVEEGNIHWASKNFGNLVIKQSEVSDIMTTTPMKINGVPTPCLIEGMQAEYLVYVCGGDPDERRVPLASLSAVIPYESYVAGDFNYRGRLNLSGAYARGNDVRDDWKLYSTTEFRRTDWRHTAMVEYARYSQRKQPADSKWGGRYTLDWFFRERWFLFSDVSLGSDEQRGIDRYYTAGSGTGYQFWESQRTALSLTGGVMYVNEVYEVPENPAPDFVDGDERAAWRLGMDFRYRLPLGVSLFHKNQLVSSLEEDEDWQLTTATGLSTMLAKRLFSELKLDYNVDNMPQQDKKREDVRLLVGVGYEW